MKSFEIVVLLLLMLIAVGVWFVAFDVDAVVGTMHLEEQL